MLLTTADTISNREVLETKGLVTGIIVRTPTIAQGILGGLKNIIGGKIRLILMFVKKLGFMLKKR